VPEALEILASELIAWQPLALLRLIGLGVARDDAKADGGI
jgi:hypothetical protein